MEGLFRHIEQTDLGDVQLISGWNFTILSSGTDFNEEEEEKKETSIHSGVITLLGS